MIYTKSKNKEILSKKPEIQALVSKVIMEAAEIVGSTFGPGGNVVLLEREELAPLVTKDGVTVLKSLGFSKASENIILDICKEISLNTAKTAGDGTTTAIVLANAIYHHGLDFIKNNPKYNPQKFIRELNDCYNSVIIPYLKEKAISVELEEDLEKVALISCNGDEAISKIVSNAVVSAGEDGVVLIQENQGGELKIDTVDGYIITSGLKNIGSDGTLFFNDKASQQVILESGLILIYDGSMTDLNLLSKVQDCLENDSEIYGKPLIIIANSFADNIVDRFVKATRGGIPIIPIKPPLDFLPKQIFLHDMEAYTGAKVMDGGSIGSFSSDDFGSFKNAKINLYECFLKCDLNSEKIDQRAEELKSLMSSAFSDMDRDHYKKHISQLTGGLVTIFVSGMTDVEIREKKDRIQDAIEAIRSAISEGIVLGGCATQITLSSIISNTPNAKPSWKVLSDALLSPLKLLLNNCGEGELYSQIIDSMLGEIKDNNKITKIFNADTHQFEDGFNSGIIEPAKVHKVAIGNSLSIASILVTLGGVVSAPLNPELEAQLEASKMMMNSMMDNQV